MPDVILRHELIMLPDFSIKCPIKVLIRIFEMLEISELLISVCLSRIDADSCEFVIGWETRSACAVKQHEVEMVNGTIQIPDTGAILSLGALYFR